jgi:hypothetical protein
MPIWIPLILAAYLIVVVPPALVSIHLWRRLRRRTGAGYHVVIDVNAPRRESRRVPLREAGAA